MLLNCWRQIINKMNNYSIRFLLLLAALLLHTICGTLVSAQSADRYVVYESAGTYYARNIVSGADEFSGSDAGAVINSAISAIGDSNSIGIQAGSYSIKTTIVLRSGLRIHGNSGTVLELNFDGDIFTGNAVNDAEISNLEIDGNNDTHSGRAVYLSNSCKRCSVIDLYIHNISENAIDFRSAGSEHNRISGNRIEDCEQVGIYYGDGADHGTITSNLIQRSGLSAIQLGTGSSHCKVSLNTIVNAGFNFPGSGQAHGILATGDSSNAGEFNVIKNNTVLGSRDSAIYLDSSLHYTVVSGNVVKSTANNGIGIYLGGGSFPSSFAAVIGNVITDTIGTGIRIDAPDVGNRSSNVVIGSNCIAGSGESGIAVYKTKHLNIEGNISSNNGSGGSLAYPLYSHVIASE